MNTPIINARRQLHWHRRLLSDATTAALWGLWLWLCRPVVLILARWFGAGSLAHHPHSHSLHPHPATVKLVAMGTQLAAAPTPSLQGAMVALAAISGVLVLWNRLFSQPSVRPRLTATPDYAGYFGVDAQTIAAGRESTVCTVHHDEQGRITHIEPKPAIPSGEPTLSKAA